MDVVCHFSSFQSKAAQVRTIYAVIQSVKNTLALCISFLASKSVNYVRFKWVTILCSEVFLDSRLYCFDRWLQCFRAHPTCVFIWEWGICVVCSYFGFVVHNENCCEVSQVYCYQQVPVLANVSHCFRVLLQPIKVFKPHIAVTHWRSNTVFVFFCLHFIF